METVVTGRNVEIPDHFHARVDDKIAAVERYSCQVIRFDVELYHENNPRQSKVCQRVEITGRGGGSTVRAEACGPDFYVALDSAMGKLHERLRRLRDRRKVHYGSRQPTSVAEATAPSATTLLDDQASHDQPGTENSHYAERTRATLTGTLATALGQ